MSPININHMVLVKNLPVDLPTIFWRVVRAVEGARLESVYICKGIEGSNPSLSALNF